MISFNKVTFEFGGRILYDNANFDLYPKDRIGIVGRNGAGKSTLLRLINKEYTPSAGNIQFQNNLKISFFNQDLLSFDTGDNIVEVVMQAFQHVSDLFTEVDKITHQLEENYTPELVDRLGEVYDLIDRYEGYQVKSQIQKVLSGLGFADEDFEKPYRQFSGGWRMRVMLAKCIMEKPDVLMLDEPTNHLDLPAIQWLEQYLEFFEGCITIVSHDRHFLDRICKRIFEVEFETITPYTGNFSDYIEQKSERMDLLEKQFKNQQTKLKQEMRFIERFRYKASKAKAAQSRLKQLEKIDLVELPEKDQRAMILNLKVLKQPGRIICELHNISKRFGVNQILSHTEGRVERGDKIALIGANGKGKSTLLRILNGSEPFEGNRTEGHNVKMAFFAQHQLESLNLESNIFDEIQYHSAQKTTQEIRNVLGAFLFSDEDVLKKIKVLSGGEKSRVALTKIILSDANVILLDEPTNHLDMQSVETLIEALQEYEGTFVTVSHDRHFLSQVANKIWYIENQKIKEYPGTYDEFDVWYRNNKKVEDAQIAKDKKDKKVKETGNANQQIAFNETSKQLARLKKEFEKAEAEMEAAQKDLAHLHKQLASEEVYTDSVKLVAVNELVKAKESELEILNKAWENLFNEIAIIEETL